MRAMIRQHLPGPRHHRRGIRHRSRRRGICLGARSDRRHQILHLRHAGLGHADRAHARRRAGVRHDAPAVHPRALFRRRREARYRGPAGERASARCAAAPLEDAVLFTTSPLLMNDADRASFEQRRAGGPAVALRRRLLRLLHARGRPRRSRDRNRAQALRHAAADPDHRRRRRHHHHLGEAATRPADASSRPATSACTPRRSSCCSVDAVFRGVPAKEHVLTSFTQPAQARLRCKAERCAADPLSPSSLLTLPDQQCTAIRLREPHCTASGTQRGALLESTIRNTTLASRCDLGRARMRGEQRRQPTGIAARHPAFGADPVDADV